jgi:hypothetical protein
MFYEIRTEHARPGRGPELARYMDETVIPLHQEMGMHVVGAFTVIGDEDAFRLGATLRGRQRPRPRP